MSCSRTQHSDTSETSTVAPRSGVKHSTTEPFVKYVSKLSVEIYVLGA